jgi:hypothetical protein
MSNKNKLKKGFSILTSLIFIEFLAFNGLVSINYLKLPTQSVVKDFTNKSVNNVIKWAKENKVEVAQTTEYSDTVDENKIISQSAKANTLVKNIDKLEIVSSSGPNPGTVVNLKDMLGWSIDEVVKEIEKEKLINVNIEYEFSELTKDTVIDQSKKGVNELAKSVSNLQSQMTLMNDDNYDLIKPKVLDNLEKAYDDLNILREQTLISEDDFKEFSDILDKAFTVLDENDSIDETKIDIEELTSRVKDLAKNINGIDIDTLNNARLKKDTENLAGSKTDEAALLASQRERATADLDAFIDSKTRELNINKILEFTQALGQLAFA